MFDKNTNGPTVQPEHIAIANQFAQEMITRFQPLELNEICEQIRERFVENRKMDIEATQKRLMYLQETLDRL